MGMPMPLKTISLALIANSDPDPAAAVRYALDLAGRTRAHLFVRIGVPPLMIPTLGYPMRGAASQMQAIIEEENVERTEQAEQMALMIRTEAERLGAIASVEVLSAAYDPLAPHLMRMARVSVSAQCWLRPTNRSIAISSSTCCSAPAFLCCSFLRIGASSVPSKKRSWPGMAAPLPPALCETRCRCSPTRKWWRLCRFLARRA